MRNIERQSSRTTRSAGVTSLAPFLQLRAQTLAAASGESAYQLLMAAADAERTRVNKANALRSPRAKGLWPRRLGMDPVEFLMMVELLGKTGSTVSHLRLCGLVAAAATKIDPTLRHERGLVRQIKNLIAKPRKEIALRLANRVPLTPPYLPGFVRSELKAIAAQLPAEFG